MYLYIPYGQDESAYLESLPETLCQLTGELTKIMELELIPERKLARANVLDVMTSLADKGYYLQMPPNAILAKDDSMLIDPSDSF